MPNFSSNGPGKCAEDLPGHTDKQTNKQTDTGFLGRWLNPALAGRGELASQEAIFGYAPPTGFGRPIFTSAPWTADYRRPRGSGENLASLRQPAPLRQKSTSCFASPSPSRLRRELGQE